MENLFNGDVYNLLVMVIVGAISGALAARIMSGDHFGLIINAILGIAGAVIGGYIFNLLNISPGSGIVKIIKDTFGVQLPENFIGMLVSATVGSILILWFFRIFRGRSTRRRTYN